jgi:hypothetical protein
MLTTSSSTAVIMRQKRIKAEIGEKERFFALKGRSHNSWKALLQGPAPTMWVGGRVAGWLCQKNTPKR